MSLVGKSVTHFFTVLHLAEKDSDRMFWNFFRN